MDFFIGIELTRHCNLRCAHCFRADLGEFSEIPFDSFGKILEDARKIYGKVHIAMTGGETTLHSRFYDILDLLINNGHSFHFVTNGYNYKTLFPKLFKYMSEPLFKGISVSLDGATEQTHDSIRGKDSFKRALMTMAIARTYNKEVVAQMIVHRGNEHELEAISLLCSKMGINRLHMAHMQPTPHAVQNNLMHSPEEFKTIEKKIQDLQGQFKMPIVLSAGFYDTSPLAHCRFLKQSALNIDHEGRLTACCQLSNLEGSVGSYDVVADLKQTSLLQAHQELTKMYQKLFEHRLRLKQSGQFTDLDHFHCYSCMKYFKKVEWMSEFHDNEWVKADPYFHQKSKTLKVVS